MTAMRLLPAILCVLALPAAAFAATPTKDIKPYKTFRFEYTSTKPVRGLASAMTSRSTCPATGRSRR